MNRALKRGGRDTLDLEAQTRQVLTGAVHHICVCSTGAVHRICVCSYQIKQRVTRDEALQPIRRDFVLFHISHPPTLRTARRGCLWVCPLSKSGPQSESSWCRCACKPPLRRFGVCALGERWFSHATSSTRTSTRHNLGCCVPHRTTSCCALFFIIAPYTRCSAQPSRAPRPPPLRRAAAPSRFFPPRSAHIPARETTAWRSSSTPLAADCSAAAPSSSPRISARGPNPVMSPCVGPLHASFRLLFVPAHTVCEEKHGVGSTQKGSGRLLVRVGAGWTAAS